MDDHVSRFHRDGFAVVRGMFPVAEVAELAAAFDVVKVAARAAGGTYPDEKVYARFEDDDTAGPILRLVQWSAYYSPALDRYRLDPRLLEIIAPLLGRDLKQITNVAFWKDPRASRRSNHVAYHQDCRFRRPAEAYRDLATSYIQTAIAVEPHRRENGCMLIYPGSHRLGDGALGDEDVRIADTHLIDGWLREKGLDPRALVELALEPGDVAYWHPHLIHGSGPNTSTMDRRSYVNGFMIAANCDVGTWAVRDGRPLPIFGVDGATSAAA